MSTATTLCADQHMLRVSVDNNDEGSPNHDFTQAQLIAACAAGPLKDLFTNPFAEPTPGSGVAAWGSLLSDGRLSVRVTPGGTAQSDGVGGCTFIAGTPNVFRVSIASGSVIVELRYHPTAVR